MADAVLPQRMLMQTNPKNIIISLFLFLIICQGRPLKESFRGSNVKSVRKHNHGSRRVIHSRLKKQPVKNALGKAKSSFDYDYIDDVSDHSFSDGDSREVLNYYRPETGIDRMHTRLINDDNSVRVKDPHLRFNYAFQDSEHFSHEPHKRVDSYAGEMIDDENTLSKFITPPVFENHKNKQHEEENTRILYSTPEAQNAENANTKTLLQSLDSLMSPMSFSNEERQKLMNYDDGGQDHSANSNVELNGEYHVRKNYDQNNHYDRNEDGRNYDENSNRRDSDREDYDDRRYYDDGPRRHHKSDDEMKDHENSPYNRHWKDNYDRGGQDHDSDQDYDDGAYNQDGNNNNNDNAEGRSTDNREIDRYRDKHTDSDYHDNERERDTFYRHDEGNNEERQDHVDQGGDKPIEVMQDDSGKLHPMSNEISKEELNKEVQKYMKNEHSRQ